MLPLTTGNRSIMFCGCPSVSPSVHSLSVCLLSYVCCLSVNAYFVWHDISVLSGGISVKLATNTHHVEWPLPKRLSRSAQWSSSWSSQLTCNGREIHFDAVALLRHTCEWNACVQVGSVSCINTGWQRTRAVWRRNRCFSCLLAMCTLLCVFMSISFSQVTGPLYYWQILTM